MLKKYEKPEIEYIDFKLQDSIMTNLIDGGDMGDGPSGSVGNEEWE